MGKAKKFFIILIRKIRQYKALFLMSLIVLIIYLAENWINESVTITDKLGIVFCLFLILTIFYLLIKSIRGLKEEINKLSLINEELREKEKLFRTLFEQSPIGIAIGNNNNYVSDINTKYEKIIGRSKEEILALSWEVFTHPDDLQKSFDNYRRFKSGEIKGYTLIKRYIRPNGSIVWVNLTMAPLKIGNRLDLNHLCLLEDITERVQTQMDLQESERSKAVLLSNLPGMAYRCNYDRDWTMQFVSDGCFKLTGYNADSLLYNKEVAYNDLICPEFQEKIWNIWARVIASKTVFKEEYKIITASGEHRWVFEQGQGVFNEKGEVEALEGLIIDITDQKVRENEIQYLNYRDFMTGLYNRKYFDEGKKRLDNEIQLPLAVIIGDINGVKLINDAFGHAEGDRLITETAKILLNCCRKEDVVARTGGDEFGILLPKTDIATAMEILKRIENACKEYNRKNSNEVFLISISLGCATKKTVKEDIEQIIKTAEDYMYKRKLLVHKSSHSAIISSIKATMFERSQESKEHANRLLALTKLVGRKLNLSQTEFAELELLAIFHDIGKVAIDKKILNKLGELTKEEWDEIQRHPEIGYRIAMSSPELVPIAEYILCHHEHWDGNGYPQGLKGNEIPLNSRILAIVDSYDAMTQDRIYRKAITEAAAKEEIMKNAGTRYDPKIAKLFVESVFER